MKKCAKGLALVLSIIIMALPCLALAGPAADFEREAYGNGRSTVKTVSFTPGQVFKGDSDLAIIGDLLEAVQLRTTSQYTADGPYSFFEWIMNGQQALTFGTLIQGTELHVFSSLLGDNVLSFTPEEIILTYLNILENMTASAELDGEAQEMLDNALGEMRDLIRQGSENIEAMVSSQLGDMMSAFALLGQLSFDEDIMESSMAGVLEEIDANSTYEKGEFLGDFHDPASAKGTVTIKPEYLNVFIDAVAEAFVTENNVAVLREYLGTVSEEGATMTDEELDTQLRSVFQMVKEDVFGYIRAPIVIAVLMNDAGETVAFDISTAIAPPNVDFEDAIPLKITLGNKAAEHGVVTQLACVMGNEYTTLKLVADWLTADPYMAGEQQVEDSIFKIEFQAIGDEDETVFRIALAYDAQSMATATDAAEDWSFVLEVEEYGTVTNITAKAQTVAAYDGTDMTSDTTIALVISEDGEQMPIGTTTIKVASGEPVDVLTVPDTNVHLGQMTAEETAAWGEEILPDVMTGIGQFIQYLPMSILQQIAPMLQGM